MGEFPVLPHESLYLHYVGVGRCSINIIAVRLLQFFCFHCINQSVYGKRNSLVALRSVRRFKNMASRSLSVLPGCALCSYLPSPRIRRPTTHAFSERLPLEASCFDDRRSPCTRKKCLFPRNIHWIRKSDSFVNRGEAGNII